MNSVAELRKEFQEDSLTIEDFKIKAAGLMVKAVNNSDDLSRMINRIEVLKHLFNGRSYLPDIDVEVALNAGVSEILEEINDKLCNINFVFDSMRSFLNENVKIS